MLIDPDEGVMVPGEDREEPKTASLLTFAVLEAELGFQAGSSAV